VLHFFDLVKQEIRTEVRPAAAAPTPAPPTMINAPVEEVEQRSVLPSIVTGAGTLVAIGGAATATWAELSMQQPKPFNEREPQLLAGRIGLVASAVGVVAAVVGVSLMVTQ
jgi:hypothetical protein